VRRGLEARARVEPMYRGETGIERRRIYGTRRAFEARARGDVW
jgi:hypothetical protein